MTRLLTTLGEVFTLTESPAAVAARGLFRDLDEEEQRLKACLDSVRERKQQAFLEFRKAVETQ